jgi:hypothetical protein
MLCFNLVLLLLLAGSMSSTGSRWTGFCCCGRLHPSIQETPSLLCLCCAVTATIACVVAACRQYDQRGIQMDRLLLWEAAPINPPSSIFSELPKELFHKYQYFNIPAGTDYTDTSHPVSTGAI